MICVSSLLPQEFSEEAAAIFSAFEKYDLFNQLLGNTKDIWLRDFMPVRTGSGRLISFRYEPSYLEKEPHLRTDFRRDIAPWLGLPVIYTDINLDGGNVVYAPSCRKVIISDRVYAENPSYTPAALVRELESLLEAAGMVRFVDENTVIGNDMPAGNGLEQRIKRVLRNHGIEVIDFPYQPNGDTSAIGCYLNFLETEGCIFLPVFGLTMDEKAITATRQIFGKAVEPIRLSKIAAKGGCLNCISWTM